jgi:hypothetical protein
MVIKLCMELIHILLNKCLRFINTQIEERYFNKSGSSLYKVLDLNLNIFKVKDNLLKHNQ